jgi:xylulose-5-phosphate/fructose-6-phosphate phosphoketolase
VLPILHLNGYKIDNPTLLARISHEEPEGLLRGYGYTPCFVEGSDPETMHQAMAATVEHCIEEIRSTQQEARSSGVARPPRWPMIVLRSPKGWTAPDEVDGHKLEGFWRAHQVPLAGVQKNPEHRVTLETWMRSYKPEELFDKSGRLIQELRELAPGGDRRMGSNPHANGGRLKRALRMPDFRRYRIEVEKPGQIEVENTPPLGTLLRDVMNRT